MTRKRLITEGEVRRAGADGRTAIDVSDAVVTPSARDLAARLRISLGNAGAPPGGDDARGRGVSRPSKREGPETGRSPSPRAKRERPETDRPPATPAKRERTGPAPAAGPPSKRERPEAGPAAGAGGEAAATVPTAGSAAPGLAVAIGADHGGVALKGVIAKRLEELGHEVADVGTDGTDAVDYPDFAEKVARLVGERRAAFGIMIDGAGIGSCMAANKVAGVRAAMCYDVTTATNAREHNFANVLTLGAGLIGERLAVAIVETFLSTPTGAARHAARVAKIDALDKRG